tara:strand:- start:1590 stop:2042 length:453 start_codon:yes stop_codon:yes gene_type:complete
MINRRQALVGGFAIAGGSVFMTGAAQAERSIVVYKSPTCGCCNAWVTHLRESGLDVETRELNDMAMIKQRLGVPDELWSCHTAIIEFYVIEGHVPAAEIERLVAERPAIRGLAVPGMPAGSPGMEMSGNSQPYTVHTFSDAGTSAFAHYD